MELMIKLAAAAVSATLCAVVLRRGAAEVAFLLTLAAGCWILLAVSDSLAAVLATMEELSRVSGLDRAVVEPVTKTVALSLMTRITAEVCRCAGEGGVAAFVETAGTILALVVALPLIHSVMELMGEMLL
ncbi:MAG: stage III sporulation protein AD [Clostridium sp.]|nr:stage III sporulation protein AD [Clostridium sp.]